MARILIADDHALVRDTISLFLSESGAHNVSSVDSVEACVQAVQEHGAPDLILLDYRMPGMEDLDGLRRMIAMCPGVPVALLSGAAGHAVGGAALAEGAAGFLQKSMTPEELSFAVSDLLSGRKVTPDMDGDLPNRESLTRREYEVLRGVAKGLSNKEIARELGVTEVTIKLHVKTMCRKLDARNRTHAAMRGLELGLL